MQIRTRSRFSWLPAGLIACGCLVSCASISLNFVLVSQSFAVVSEDGQPSDVKAKQLADAVHRQMTVQRATRFLIPVGAVFVALGVVLLVVRRRGEHGND